MLALARLQRKFRLLESPYRTPQTLVGGPRADAALIWRSGPDGDHQGDGRGLDAVPAPGADRGAAEGPRGVARVWAEHHGIDGDAQGLAAAAHRRLGAAGAERRSATDDEKLANIVFATIQDRRGRSILSVRDQNTFDAALRRKRLMTLLHLFLIHRYKAHSVHYLTPTEDNHRQTASMQKLRHLREHHTRRSARSSSPTSTPRSSPRSCARPTSGRELITGPRKRAALEALRAAATATAAAACARRRAAVGQRARARPPRAGGGLAPHYSRPRSKRRCSSAVRSA